MMSSSMEYPDDDEKEPMRIDCQECYETCTHLRYPYLVRHEALPIKTLYIEVIPSTFRISTDPAKPTKFEIRNRTKTQDKVFVFCASYIFELKNPKNRKGAWTQITKHMMPEEVLHFEVGLKNQKDITIEDRDPRMVTAAGFIEIAHYPETPEEEQFRITRKSKKQLQDIGPKEMFYRLDNHDTWGTDRGHQGCWKEDLIPDQDTEFVTSKTAEFPEVFQKALADKEEEEFIKEKGDCKEMCVPPKPRPKRIIEAPKPKEEEKKKKKKPVCCC